MCARTMGMRILGRKTERSDVRRVYLPASKQWAVEVYVKGRLRAVRAEPA